MDVLIKNATIVTMDKRRRVLKNFSLGVEGGRITEISQELRETLIS
jgi:cytosine/adenosine deaminase-related metal-dependent hydrolase